MDLQPNKIDGIVKPITNTRISASEWNQLVGSCMAFITAAGFTPDADDNQQFLNAFIQIAQDIGAIGANVDLSNLSATGENHFVKLQSGVSQADVDYVVESYQNGTSWYRVYKSGWCEQGGSIAEEAGDATQTISFLKTFSSAPTVQVTPIAISDTTMGAASYGVLSTSTSNFAIRANNTYWSTLMWQASGYIA